MMDDDYEKIIGNNQIEDVRWICSLTDSELDLLINLKCLAKQRAKRIGHVDLAEKFDLKMLRGLSFVLMDNLKDQLKGLSLGSSEGSAFLSGCNLLRCDPDGDFANMGLDELKEYVWSVRQRKKKLAEVFEDMSFNKKQKCDDR